MRKREPNPRGDTAMTSSFIWNMILIVPFLLAFIGIPLWMTWKHLDRAADHSASRQYLATKAEYLAARADRRDAKAGRSASRPLTVDDVLRPLAPADVTEDPELVLAGRR
ncbi:MAG: hypothetical protein ACR2FU_16455 [Streptosporangiaceae bacterium]